MHMHMRNHLLECARELEWDGRKKWRNKGTEGKNERICLISCQTERGKLLPAVTIHSAQNLDGFMQFHDMYQH